MNNFILAINCHELMATLLINCFRNIVKNILNTIQQFIYCHYGQSYCWRNGIPRENHLPMTLVDNLYSTLAFQILKINHELPKNSYSQMCDSALVNYHCHPVTRRGRHGRDHMAYGSWFYNYLCNRYLSPLILFVLIKWFCIPLSEA